VLRAERDPAVDDTATGHSSVMRAPASPQCGRTAVVISNFRFFTLRCLARRDIIYTCTAYSKKKNKTIDV